jgi:predicted aspartyl protease
VRKFEGISLLVWLATLSCAPAAKPPPPVAEEAFVLDSKEDPNVLKGPLAGIGGKGKVAAITFLPNRVRAPAVHGSVHGKETWMLIDTGASRHFISDWMIRRIFADDISQSATDHIGRTIKASRLDEPQMKLDGWGMVPDTVAMITSSGNESSDLGVVMSPQQLAGSGAVVLDFPNKAMTLMSSRDSAERSLSKNGATLGRAEKCGGVYFVSAKIGDTNAKMMVDTGAWATDLRPQSAPARALTMHSSDGLDRGYGAGGAINSHRLPKIAVTVGAVHATIDIQLLDDATETGACRFDGVLGMDVFQSCVLVVDDGGITGKCAPSANF